VKRGHPHAQRRGAFVSVRALSAATLAALLIVVSAPAVHAQAARPKVHLQCEVVGIGPTLDCRVRVAAPDGQPLAGATVTLSATMPSMPMAHRVAPAVAAASGAAGEYRGTLQLEMSGVWALQIDLAGPVRDRAVVRLQADECAQGRERCAAMPHALKR
jgi:YtkA-like